MASTQHVADDAWPADFVAKTAPPGKMTEEEFVAWCGDDTRAEWVDGEVIVMSPQNDIHGDLCDWLISVSKPFVEKHDLGKMRSVHQVRLPIGRRRDPDLLFVAKDRLHLWKPTYVDGSPDLIFEVVSPDSVARDWREKYLEYQSSGVKEYWIVDPLAEAVEAYILEPAQAPAGEGKYRRIEERDGILRSVVLPGFFVHTRWLWPATRPLVLDALRELGVI